MPEIKCPYCGETIEAEDLEGLEEEVFNCPFCGKVISLDDI